MSEVIVGGAIAAVIGAAAGLAASFLLTYLKNKKEQTIIVSEPIVEVKENLVICTDPSIRKLWWTVKYKTDAYNKHKGEIGFLPEAIRTELANIAYLVEPINSSVDVHRLQSAFKTHTSPLAFRPQPKFEPLEKSLIFCRDGLESWPKKPLATPSH